MTYISVYPQQCPGLPWHPVRDANRDVMDESKTDSIRSAGSDEARLHASSWVRGLLIAAGWLCVALGVIGIFVPLLPTTPFMLLAAACFARSSRRFHDWLLANRTFGPLIYEWRRFRSIPFRTKITAIALLAFTLGASIVFFVRPPWLKVALALFGLALAVWLYRIPSRPARDEDQR